MNSNDILTDIRKIVRSINLESKRIQKEYGLSIPQVLCLQFLTNQSNYQATNTAIREALSLNPSTVTGIIDRLEKKGMVARLPKIDDRRASLVTITVNGLETISKAPNLMHDHLSSKLSKLSSGDVNAIKTGLKLLVNILGIENLDASPVITPDEPVV